MDSQPPSDQSPRRGYSRLRLGIAARLETIAGKQSVRLIDLSQTGARLILSQPGDARDAVLTWLGFEAFGSVIWREGDQVGMHFDDLVPTEQLLETRRRAPSVVREEELETRAAAREWVAGERHHGTER